jgi:hypothetical protein
MAENLVEDVNLLVAHMSVNSTTWTQTIHAHNVGGGDLTSTSNAVVQFHDFCIANTPDAGFIESISGYKVFQRQIGSTNVEHPPIFTNTYHEAGTHDANYNGSPIGAPLPKDVAVYAKCATSGGRSGKLFVRNLLEESDVDSAVSGTWEFTAGSTRFTVARFATVVTASLATCFVGGEHAADNLFVVAHLLLVKPTDTRSAFFTPITSCTAIRPVWNRAHR